MSHGLIYRWKMAEPPGITRRPSLLLISPRGARLLADLHGESPWRYVRRAKDAWTDADLTQRGRLITSILSEVLVKDRRIAGIRPRPGWAPYFEELLRTIGSRQRETGLEPATACLEGRCSTS